MPAKRRRKPCRGEVEERLAMPAGAVQEQVEQRNHRRRELRCPSSAVNCWRVAGAD